MNYVGIDWPFFLKGLGILAVLFFGFKYRREIFLIKPSKGHVVSKAPLIRA